MVCRKFAGIIELYSVCTEIRRDTEMSAEKSYVIGSPLSKSWPLSLIHDSMAFQFLILASGSYGSSSSGFIPRCNEGKEHVSVSWCHTGLGSKRFANFNMYIQGMACCW